MDKRKKIVANRLKDLRKEHHYTMDALAERIGVTKSAISKWESGQVENMRQDTIMKLASLYNVTPAYIAGYEELSEEDMNNIKITEEKEEQARLNLETADIFMKEYQEQIRQEGIKDREKFLANIVTIYNTLSYESAKDLCDYAEYLKYRDFKRSKEKINEE